MLRLRGRRCVSHVIRQNVCPNRVPQLELAGMRVDDLLKKGCCGKHKTGSAMTMATRAEQRDRAGLSSDGGDSTESCCVLRLEEWHVREALGTDR